MVLVVDNSSGHYAVGDSGLNASGMNMSEGGKQHRLDDGFYFTKDAAGFISQVVQPMCVGLDEYERLQRKDAQGLPCVWYKHRTSGVELKTMPPSAKAKGLKLVLRECAKRWLVSQTFQTREAVLSCCASLLAMSAFSSPSSTLSSTQSSSTGATRRTSSDATALAVPWGSSSGGTLRWMP